MDQSKDGASSENWSAIASVLLMLHGGAAMTALLLLGGLVPLHLLPRWRQEKNRVAGVAIATATALLIVTAFGLYYIGSDALRAWTSDIHIIMGLVFPALLTVHVAVGRHRCAPHIRPKRPSETCRSAAYLAPADYSEKCKPRSANP